MTSAIAMPANEVSATLRGLVEHFSPSGQEEGAVSWLVEHMRVLGFSQAYSDGAGNAGFVAQPVLLLRRLGAEVVLIVVEGGGHTWPGRKPRFRGKSALNISANDLIWEFFEKHPMK